MLTHGLLARARLPQWLEPALNLGTSKTVVVGEPQSPVTLHHTGGVPS